MDLWDFRSLFTRYDLDLDNEERENGYCDIDGWSRDLGDGVTIHRMTLKTHPHSSSLGGGNFIFRIAGKDFAYLGHSYVHAQLHIALPEGLSTEEERAWHTAVLRILKDNRVPFAVTYPANQTAGYLWPGYDLKYHPDQGSSHFQPLMREDHTREADDEEQFRYDPIQLGTNFIQPLIGQPWKRCEFGSEHDAHISYSLGLKT